MNERNVRAPIVHDLKITTEYYKLVAAGIKTAESRRYDRDFRAGDTLILQEYVPEKNLYTGRIIELLITHVLTGEYVKDGYCILSFQMLFPIIEPRLSVTTWERVYDLYLEARKELEIMKEKMVQKGEKSE